MLRTLLVIAGLCASCVATAYPPLAPVDAVTVYLLRQGEHTGVILPAPPQSDAAWVEYAFGDWGWYGEGRNSTAYGMYALAVPSSAALGRRYATEAPEHDAVIARRGASFEAFQAESARVIELRNELDEEYEAAGVVPREVANSGLLVVPARHSYTLNYNCSDATIVWLRRLGCSVPVGGITRSVVLGPARP
ncbi:MAG: hypothetical protein O3A20_10810 [Planctomycetota bacterium]|nr:hypothetical protein [Planctomycetota bacterium]